MEENIDIISEVGKYASYTAYIEFELRKDNKIYFKGLECEGAYDKKAKTLKVEF